MTRQRLSKFMLTTNLICSIFYSMSYPYIYAEMMKVVNHFYISGEQIVTCLGVIIFGLLWNKKGDVLYKHYLWIVTAEIIADGFLFAHVLITGDLKFYFVLNVLIYALITRNMANGGIRLRAKIHPDERSRERYDNNCNIVNSVATLVGAGIAIIIPMSLTVLFIAALVGNVFDNFCYYYIYCKANALAEKDKQKGTN